MHKIILAMMALCMVAPSSKAQSLGDSGATVEIVHFEWMPDNVNLLLNIMKLAKGQPPLSREYTFNLTTKKLDFLIADARGAAASPDGKTIAYAKRLAEGKLALFLYDREKKLETALAADTLAKFAPQWSPDGKQLAYNIIRNGKIDICVIDLASGSIWQITPGAGNSSYDPIWSPAGDRIVYYLEKGDHRDQVYLTDPKGSFQSNLTNDTSTHNFYPSWFGNDKILYTWAPHSAAIMDRDGHNRTKIEGVETFFARYNPKNHKIAYLTMLPGARLMIYDWDHKTMEEMLNRSQLAGLF
jgi:tricorn protease-like protein